MCYSGSPRVGCGVFEIDKVLPDIEHIMNHEAGRARAYMRDLLESFDRTAAGLEGEVVLGWYRSSI